PEVILVTASAVGAPAAKEAYALPTYYIKAVALLAKYGDAKVEGLITNESGGLATVNGWLQSAALGVPVVDAPCNGRAHPTGVMGSLGLHKNAGYVATQTAVGGNPETGRYVEIFVRGALDKTAALVRQAAVQAGGMVAVARNPVTAAYARDNAAPGAVKQAIAIGRAMRAKQGAGPLAMIEAVCEELHAEIVARGEITDVQLETKGGFDVGTVVVKTAGQQRVELAFWNEYVSLEVAEGAQPATRVGTFPDLMATFDLATGLPVSSAQVVVGEQIAVVRAPRERLILGAGMRDPDLARAIEEATGKAVVKYVFG
ncbi:MAG: DUF917 family protein, partial [Dehalococcoidales bacterium]|nr:DUF917 family protein [Dehalococcoidales bacterium]